jgi:hypothetical protein
MAYVSAFRGPAVRSPFAVCIRLEMRTMRRTDSRMAASVATAEPARDSRDAFAVKFRRRFEGKRRRRFRRIVGDTSC